MIQLIGVIRDSPVINWGDVATWVTGLATIALFIVAFIQIRTERVLRLKREARHQAEVISAWIVREGMSEFMEDGEPVMYPAAWVVISNQSPQPIYQAIVSIFAVSQTGDHLRGELPVGQVCVGLVPPGQGYICIKAGYHGMFRRPGVEIAFRDGAGNNWVRKPWGDLLEIEISTIEYYQIALPANWEGLYSEMPSDEELYSSSGEISDSQIDDTTS